MSWVPGTWSQVFSNPGTEKKWSRVPGAAVPDPRFRVNTSWEPGPRTQEQKKKIPGSRYRVPGLFKPGNKQQKEMVPWLPGPRFRVNTSWEPEPGPRTQDPGTINFFKSNFNCLDIFDVYIGCRDSHVPFR